MTTLSTAFFGPCSATPTRSSSSQATAATVAREYLMHARDTWTLLPVDRGAVRYQFEGQERMARPGDVTLLPPRTPHDGAAATGDGFRKRVIYLDRVGMDPKMAALTVRDPVRNSRVLHRQVAGKRSFQRPFVVP